MNEHHFWYHVKKANGFARTLIFPTFLVGSVLTYCSSMARTTVTWFEMPVITLKCEMRHFATEKERAEAIANPEIPIQTCEEVVTWAGEDQKEIRALAYTKGLEIANSLFAHPQNPAIVRESAAKTIDYFERDSNARSEYKRRMEEVINKSASFASGWKPTTSYVRFIERDNSNENRWIVKFTGISVDENDKQKGRDVSLMLSFKPTKNNERKDAQQALIVTEWEMSGNEN